jgi:hypothetical protein
MATTSEIPDSMELKKLSPGSQIDVETKSRHYHIECLGGNAIRIHGHPEYCPMPVVAQFHGSVDNHGAVDAGVIERGMRLRFFVLGEFPVTTSAVMDYHLERSAGY